VHLLCWVLTLYLRSFRRLSLYTTDTQQYLPHVCV